MPNAKKSPTNVFSRAIELGSKEGRLGKIKRKKKKKRKKKRKQMKKKRKKRTCKIFL